jgi:hypothetical protein
MAHANSERMAADADQNKTSSIAISKFWEEELKSMPYLSCKYSIIYWKVLIFLSIILYITERSGKTVHLLKSGSKKIATDRKRKKHELMGTISQYKESKQKPKSQAQVQPPVPV